MTMAGLLRTCLFGAQANTGTGSQPANQNGLDMSTLQAAAPWGNGRISTRARRQTSSSRQARPNKTRSLQLLQSMMGMARSNNPNRKTRCSRKEPIRLSHATPQWQPSPEQSQRLAQWENLLPSSSSGSIEDRRDVPELAHPPQLPAAMLGQAGAASGVAIDADEPVAAATKLAGALSYPEHSCARAAHDASTAGQHRLISNKEGTMKWQGQGSEHRQDTSIKLIRS